ncbi:MAG: AAA family ATPase [Candidatus Sulfotelmatobacter sp.]
MRLSPSTSPPKLSRLKRNRALFSNAIRHPCSFDEVQYAPGLFRHLKVAVDAHRTRNGQFLLTGSQKLTLMKNVSESLGPASNPQCSHERNGVQQACA